MWTFCQHQLNEWGRSMGHHLVLVSYKSLFDNLNVLGDVKDPETPKMLVLARSNKNVGVATTPGMLVTRSGEPKRQPAMLEIQTRIVTGSLERNIDRGKKQRNH
jgi:hypothetical protein